MDRHRRHPTHRGDHRSDRAVLKAIAALDKKITAADKAHAAKLAAIARAITRLDKKLDQVLENVVPGPAVKLVLTPGPITEQKELRHGTTRHAAGRSHDHARRS